jgi:metal-responsive CopG/Arc/MetJ family transcriptional regulator
VTRRRIEPRPAVELETVSLRLPAELVHTLDDYAKYLGGSTDRTYVITQALEIALERDTDFQKRRQARPATAAAAPARGTV